MKFACPMCEAAGEISEDDLIHPVTRTTCRNCGTILMINPDSGNVDAHKSPLKDSSTLETSDSRSSDRSEPVLSMHSKGEDARDWTAVVVVAFIMIILICAGVYFAVKLDTVKNVVSNNLPV